MTNIRRINTTQPIILDDNMVSCVAAEDIKTGSVIVRDINNKVYTADIYDETHAHRTIGIAIETANIGEPVITQMTKTFVNNAWNFEFNTPVYIGDYGIPTQIKPTKGFVQMVGIPYNSNSIYIDIEPAILFDFFKPILLVTQNQYMLSPNQTTTFNCINTGYELIEWQVFGKSPTIIENTNIGPDLNSINVKWGTIGLAGVKVRIKDNITKIWSKWSNILPITIM